MPSTAPSGKRTPRKRRTGEMQSGTAWYGTKLASLPPHDQETGRDDSDTRRRQRLVGR